MRQIDHEAGIAPCSAFCQAPSLKHHNARSALQLLQPARSRQAGEAAPHNDEIGGSISAKLTGRRLRPEYGVPSRRPQLDR